jgi:hypothetical protein
VAMEVQIQTRLPLGKILVQLGPTRERPSASQRAAAHQCRVLWFRTREQLGRQLTASWARLAARWLLVASQARLHCQVAVRRPPRVLPVAVGPMQRRGGQAVVVPSCPARLLAARIPAARIPAARIREHWLALPRAWRVVPQAALPAGPRPAMRAQARARPFRLLLAVARG